MEKKKAIEQTLSKYSAANRRFVYSDNNLRYIKAIKSMLFWLNRFDSLLSEIEREKGEYSALYQALFISGCGFSEYTRICNTIEEYKYGNKPF